MKTTVRGDQAREHFPCLHPDGTKPHRRGLMGMGPRLLPEVSP